MDHAHTYLGTGLDITPVVEAGASWIRVTKCLCCADKRHLVVGGGSMHNAKCTGDVRHKKETLTLYLARIKYPKAAEM